MGTRKDTDADNINVLLNSGQNDLLGPAMKSRIDDLHSRVTETTGDHFGATVVPVQANLCNENSKWSTSRRDSRHNHPLVKLTSYGG